MLTPRSYREYKNLGDLDTSALEHQRVAYLHFSEEEQREIIFKDITTSEVTHTTILDTAGIADYRSVIGYFAQTLMKDLRLVSGYDVLYGKVKAFVQTELFDQRVDLEHPNMLRNLSELAATKTLIETFKKAINALTVRDRGDAEIRDTIKLRQTRPFVVKDQGYLIPKKSVFNRVIGDSQLELLFASFLEDCPDVVSYAKNYFAVHFKLDFANGTGITSEMVFLNPSTQPSRPAVYFYDTEGALVAPESVVDITGDLEITEDGGLTVWTEMEPLRVLTISTHGRGPLVTGSVRVVSDGPIGGLLRFDLPGVGAGVVGASQPISDALFPVRHQAGGIRTAAALHNLEAEAMGVRCRLMSGGVALEEVEIHLEANGQASWFIEDAFTTTDTSDFLGSVRCTAPGNGRFTAVALEMDAANRIFTTLPVVPVKR